MNPKDFRDYYESIYNKKINIESLKTLKEKAPNKSLKKQLVKNCILKNSKEGEKILSIGCGLGEYLDLFKNYKIYGSDISYNALKIAKSYSKHAKFIRADAEKLPFKTSSFDTILMIDCLEHIPNDKKAFDEARRVLKKGGILVLSSGFSGKNKTLNLVNPKNLSENFSLNEFGEGGDLRAYGTDFINNLKKDMEIKKQYYIESYLSKRISFFKNALLRLFFKSSNIIEKEAESLNSKNSLFHVLSNLYHNLVLTFLKLELFFLGKYKKNKRVFILCCRKK